MIYDAHRPIAALDIGGNPRLAIDKAMAPARRELVAATCMALLMRRFLE